jgi:PAS domain S-box-containing protein
MNSQTNIVITTNGEVLKTANKALFDFFEISSVDEFLSKYGKCICDTFKLCETDEYLQKMVDDQKWIDFVYDNPSKLHKAVIEKNGENHIFAVSADRFSFKDEELDVVVFTDITKLEKMREEIERILENILLPVLITSKKDRVILYANKYAQIQYEKSINELVGSNIDDIYTMENQYRHIVDALSNYGKVENFEEVFKTATGKEFVALLSVTPIIYNNEEAYIGMVTDITKQKEAENEIRRLHKHTKESIEYASLIQHSLIPSGDAIRAHFGEYFVIWHPKDIVGGDIYFFEDLGDGQECILFVVDCTGHGVPGAFVSMLVKAIERQVTSQIRLRNEIVSPAGLLAVFNKSMKNLLKQENDEAISNAGFDGAIIYHNKQTGVLKFAGAQTPLFYVEDGEFKTIKGDRQSIGYKKSDGNFEFTEHVIKTKPGMCFYIATDGYLDQNGGEKGFPFGKKRFGAIIEKYHTESFADQQEIFLDELHAYQKDEVRNDDITLIGFKI